MNNEKDVFISYKSEEFEKANWVKTTLENNRITCWMAPADIKGGSNYAIEIPKAIRACKVFVLVLSTKAQDSKWVPKELDQAINEEKIIMPFMLEDCLLKDDFNFYLTNVQRYEAYKDKSAAIERMIVEIKGILEKESSVEKKDELTKTIDSTNAITDEQENLGQEAETKKQKKRLPQKESSKKKHKVRKIILAIIVVIAMLVIGNKLLGKKNEITIAGQIVEIEDTGLLLQDVDLTEKEIKNIKKMEQLQYVCLENCTFSEKFISVMNERDLKEITLKNCGITNKMLEKFAFGEMENLRMLNLDDNWQLSDLSCITSVIDHLRIISINNTSIKNLDFMKDAELCYEFSAENNGIDDISVLENCINLKAVYLDGNDITSLESLKNCTELYELSVNGNALTDLNGLETCINLQYLYAGNNVLTSLDGMENMTVLERVYLNNNELSDLSMLSKSAKSLSRVYVNNNQVKELTALENCINLEYLAADNNQLTTLASLESCVLLKQLTVQYNQLTSLDGLKNCVNLYYIDASDNQLNNTDALENVGIVSEYTLKVDLSNNQISDLKLGKDKCYQYLDLSGNAIQNFDVLLENEVKNAAFDYLNTSVLESFSEYKHYLWIMNCPLDQQLIVKDMISDTYIVFDDLSEFERLKFIEIKNNILGKDYSSGGVR